MKKINIIILTISLILGDSVFAMPFNQHQGWYGEVTAGTNFYSINVSGSTSGKAGQTESYFRSGFKDNGFSFAGGYTFKPDGISLEGGFFRNNFTGVDVTATDGTGSPLTISANAHANTAYLAARWDIAIGNRFAFIPKIGGMYVSIPNVSVSTTQNGKHYSGTLDGLSVVLPFVGLGASYSITNQLALTLQYQGAVYAVVNFGLASVGLDYHF